MGKRFIYLSVVLLIAAGITGVLISWSRRTQTLPSSSPFGSTQTPEPSVSLPTPAPGGTVISGEGPDDWKTYRNEALGFQTSFPPDWFVFGGKDDVFFASYDMNTTPGRGSCCPGTNARIDIYVYDKPVEWSLEQAAQDSFVSSTYVAVGGRRALQGLQKSPNPDGGPPSRAFTSIVPGSDRIYSISIQGSIEQFRQVYDRLLQSFEPLGTSQCGTVPPNQKLLIEQVEDIEGLDRVTVPLYGYSVSGYCLTYPQNWKVRLAGAQGMNLIFNESLASGTRQLAFQIASANDLTIETADKATNSFDLSGQRPLVNPDEQPVRRQIETVGAHEVLVVQTEKDGTDYFRYFVIHGDGVYMMMASAPTPVSSSILYADFLSLVKTSIASLRFIR